MNKRKRIAVIVLVCVGTLVVSLGIWAASASRPDMPAEWSKVRLGMPRQEVLALFNDEVNDLREEKGFDSTGREVTMLGRRSFWVLLITYDSSGKVASAEASFTRTGFGLFNTRKKLL